MDEKILKELVRGILSIMESQVVRIVLYGSVARGTNTAESDVDVALIMNGTLDGNTEDKLSDLVVDMNLKYDRVFSVIDIDYDVFKKWEKITPFYKNVAQEGIVLWKAA
jgi:predicted nucleotidyltransferase